MWLLRLLVAKAAALLEALPAARLSLLMRRSRPSAPDTSSVPWKPLPGPQTRAYESKADITGFGGSAGGGKSALAIGLAVTKHRRSLIFRREQTQVRDLWQKLGNVCSTAGRSNENLLLWRDLPGDRQVTLAGCKNEGDWRKHMGHENDFIDFDEGTEFSEYQVRTLIAWNRSAFPGQRCRVVIGFNPPSRPEGEWVIDFFGPWLDANHPNPAEPGELRWYSVVDGKDAESPDGTPFEHNGEIITPLSRTFFPARLEDNPILEATGYRATLQNVPEPLRSQLLYGDFTIGLQDDPWQVIPTAWVLAAQARWKPTPPSSVPDQHGIDVAQGGPDNTVDVRRHRNWFSEPEVIPGREVPDAKYNADNVERMMVDGGVGYIDADGIGSSTYFLARATIGKRIRAYQGSAPTAWRDKAKVLAFVNTRAAAWWKLREALDPSSGENLALPPGRELRIELCAPHWEKQTNGVKIEPKKDIKERLGHSPDLADAVVMAFWDGRNPLEGVLARAITPDPLPAEPDITKNLPTLNGRLLPEQRPRLRLTRDR